jgi:hypothetical protein
VDGKDTLIGMELNAASFENLDSLIKEWIDHVKDLPEFYYSKDDKSGKEDLEIFFESIQLRIDF